MRQERREKCNYIKCSIKAKKGKKVDGKNMNKGQG